MSLPDLGLFQYQGPVGQQHVVVLVEVEVDVDVLVLVLVDVDVLVEVEVVVVTSSHSQQISIQHPQLSISKYKSDPGSLGFIRAGIALLIPCLSFRMTERKGVVAFFLYILYNGPPPDTDVILIVPYDG